MLNRRGALATPMGALIVLLLVSTLALVALAKADPYMKSAATQLKKARAHLYAGENDKAGHRARAMAYTTAAIDEITLGMKSDHHHHAPTRASFTATTSGGMTFAGSHMTKALGYLKQGQTNLAAATPDAGGHHAKAMELITKAIEEVEKANAPGA